MLVHGIVSKYSSRIMRPTQGLGFGGPLALVRAEVDFPACFFSLMASFLMVANGWFPGLTKLEIPGCTRGQGVLDRQRLGEKAWKHSIETPVLLSPPLGP